MFAVIYELGFYIQEDGILHSHRREHLKSYIQLTGWALQRRRSVFPVRYELSLYIPEDNISRRHRRENLKSYKVQSYILRQTDERAVGGGGWRKTIDKSIDISIENI
jgi:hypothetical protein